MSPTSIVSTAFGVATAPLRLGIRIATGLLGGGQEAPPPEPQRSPRSESRPRQRRRRAPDPQRSRTPKPLDDVALARKVESVIFRDRGVTKGKIDVNAAEGVVWLRGEAKTPDLIKRLEDEARAIPEVRQVENLLHLPKTPAPSRSDTPPSQRRTRRSKPPLAEHKE